jgi:hypothetical protein
MPQYSDAGEVEVTAVNAIDPVNLVLSVPPNASEPLTSSSVVVGSKEMPTTFPVIVP